MRVTRRGLLAGAAAGALGATGIYELVDRLATSPQRAAARDLPSEQHLLDLRVVHDEATNRGYNFDRSKIGRLSYSGDKMQRIPVTLGQLRYEWKHLQLKLEQRNPGWLASLSKRGNAGANPVFRVIAGTVETWEKRRL